MLAFKKTLEKATALIEISGMSLGTALAQAGGFPELMIQLIEVGVSAGQICEVLDRIADQYEKDIDSTIKKVTNLIEPAMIVIVGALAGTVVISLFLPMYSIADIRKTLSGVFDEERQTPENENYPLYYHRKDS